MFQIYVLFVMPLFLRRHVRQVIDIQRHTTTYNDILTTRKHNGLNQSLVKLHMLHIIHYTKFYYIIILLYLSSFIFILLHLAAVFDYDEMLR